MRTEARASPTTGQLTGSRQPASAAEPHCEHDPRKDVTKDLAGDDLGPREPQRIVAWVHEGHRDPAVSQPRHPGRDLNNPGGDRRTADRPHGLRGGASVPHEAFATPD